MFKNIIAPVQAWLLSRGQCVGCGSLLAHGNKTERSDGSQTVTCKCGRVFIFNAKTKTYRRALFNEI